VTISGRHIGENVSTVTFGSVGATRLTVNSAESITAVSPAEPSGTVHVTVTTLGGTSKQAPADQFTFVQGPVSSSSSPSGSVGVLGFVSGCSASLLSRSISVLSRGRAAVRLIWRGPGRCRGKLRLNVKIKVGRRVKTRTIATGSFSLASRKARTITVKLNAFGRSKLEAGHGRLRASLVIVGVAPSTAARTATVRLLVRKPAKPKRR
jgi:hypothetical protein